MPQRRATRCPSRCEPTGRSGRNWSATPRSPPPPTISRPRWRLVRGRPFDGVHPRRYAWADTLRQQMSAQIVDVAYELGRRRLLSGRWQAAEAATVGRPRGRASLGTVVAVEDHGGARGAEPSGGRRGRGPDAGSSPTRSPAISNRPPWTCSSALESRGRRSSRCASRSPADPRRPHVSPGGTSRRPRRPCSRPDRSGLAAGRMRPCSGPAVSCLSSNGRTYRRRAAPLLRRPGRRARCRSAACDIPVLAECSRYLCDTSRRAADS